jgi:hypothetical protein
VLAVLTGLFAFRVVAQPLALATRTPLLPAFDAWHSGALPYPLLLATQVILLAGLAAEARAVTRGARRVSARVGQVALAAAAVYGATMMLRLVLGATLLQGHGWFDRPIPTVFHLGLAGYLAVYGHWHLRRRHVPV